jgi:hypothetical protein
MAGKRVLLTIDPRMHEILDKKAQENWMTLQELINDILRKSILDSQPRKGKTGKSPNREPFLDSFSRKR